MKKNTECFISDSIDKCVFFTILLLEFFFTIAAILSWKGLALDETEHLHMSWLVSEGLMPYRDFFEHHNPLLWYIFAPISRLFFNSAYVFYVGRIFITIISIGTLIYVYKIITQYMATKYAAFTALILNGILFGRAAFIEFRPDIIMNFCFWSGLYYYMRYMEKQKVKDLCISFLLFTLSFLFLQKIIMLLFFLGLYTLYKLCSKQDFKWRDIGYAVMAPTGLIILFIFWLYMNNSLEVYYTLNYTLNSIMPQYFGLKKVAFSVLGFSFYMGMINGYGSVVFRPCTIMMVFGALISVVPVIRKNNKYLNLFYLMFVCELVLRLFTFSPYYHYFFLLNMQAAIIVAVAFDLWNNKLKKILLILLMSCFLGNGLYESIHPWINKNPLTNYIKILEFVIKNSEPSDTVMNGNKLNYNIYRKDADYVGYILNDVGYIYNQNFGNKEYDVNEIIINRKPKIIWMEDYVNSPLYERRFQILRNFNSDLISLWSKYPDHKYNLLDIMPHFSKFNTYEMQQEKLEEYYEPSGFEKFWILKKL